MDRWAGRGQGDLADATIRSGQSRTVCISVRDRRIKRSGQYEWTVGQVGTGSMVDAKTVGNRVHHRLTLSDAASCKQNGYMRKAAGAVRMGPARQDVFLYSNSPI